jgi:hypothetical protein
MVPLFVFLVELVEELHGVKLVSSVMRNALGQQRVNSMVSEVHFYLNGLLFVKNAEFVDDILLPVKITLETFVSIILSVKQCGRSYLCNSHCRFYTLALVPHITPPRRNITQQMSHQCRCRCLNRSK